MVSYCEEPDEACDGEADDHREFDAVVEIHGDPVSQSSHETCHGVDLLSEDDGFVVEQHVAYHATRSTGDASHDDSHPVRLSHDDAFLYAGDGEERESECVEDKPCVFQRFDVFGECHHEEQCQCCAKHVERAGHPEWCGAEHDVAYGTAPYGHGNAADISTKPVEVFRCSVSYSRDGKGECTEELYDLLYGDIPKRC